VDAAEAALRALRWVADAAQPADGGVSWPEFHEPGSPPVDDLCCGTAGVRIAGWLLRLGRVRRDRASRRLPWPDLPRLAPGSATAAR